MEIDYVNIVIGFIIGVFITLIINSFRKKKLDKNEAMIEIRQQLKQGHEGLMVAEKSLRKFYNVFNNLVK